MIYEPKKKKAINNSYDPRVDLKTEIKSGKDKKQRYIEEPSIDKIEKIARK